MIELFPKEKENSSARIIISDDHTVINGTHIQISNGYMFKKDGPATIQTGDILSIEEQKLRNKLFLVISVTIFGLLLLSHAAFGMLGRFQDINKIMNYDEKTIIKYQTSFVQYVVFGGDISKAIKAVTETGETINIVEEILNKDYSSLDWLLTTRYTVYVILSISSIAVIIKYIIKPLEIVRISTMGGSFAVETKYYEKVKIKNMIDNYYKKP